MFDFMTDVSSSRCYVFIGKNIGIFFEMLEEKKDEVYRYEYRNLREIFVSKQEIEIYFVEDVLKIIFLKKK